MLSSSSVDASFRWRLENHISKIKQRRSERYVRSFKEKERERERKDETNTLLHSDIPASIDY